jgi:hypothetical protein
MKRELNLDEMKMVSGGYVPPQPPEPPTPAVSDPVAEGNDNGRDIAGDFSDQENNYDGII